MPLPRLLTPPTYWSSGKWVELLLPVIIVAGLFGIPLLLHVVVLWSVDDLGYQLDSFLRLLLKLVHVGLLLTGAGCLIALMSRRIDKYNSELWERWSQSGAPEENKRRMDEWTATNDELNKVSSQTAI